LEKRKKENENEQCCRIEFHIISFVADFYLFAGDAIIVIFLDNLFLKRFNFTNKGHSPFIREEEGVNILFC